MKDKTTAIICILFGLIIGIFFAIGVIFLMGNEKINTIIQVMDEGGPTTRALILVGACSLVCIVAGMFAGLLSFVLDVLTKKRKRK